MRSVHAQPLVGVHALGSRVHLIDVSYDTRRLVVTAGCPGDGRMLRVEFTEVVGFRVLDEGDLLEFWPACAADHGWLFDIPEGGWFDQEIERQGFVHDERSGLGEYFIAGQNDCISVLAGAPPRVEVRPG